MKNPAKEPSNPLWYKDAIIYQLHVRSFYDSNGDGIGDFRGLIEKLDYIQNLGVNTLWLLPFYPSPLRDGGYDIADFQDIHPDYGTLADFKRFVKEAHKRGLRIITELVINHTSSEHKWFQRARKAKPGSNHRDFYVWSPTQEKYKDARIIFQDFEVSNWTYDHEAGAYYWHRFYSHQPDLNFENPNVQKEIFKILDFWFEIGVDGFRLDAIPYLFEEEGTNCENLPQTHAYLKSLRKYVDERYQDKLLLAEANQWPNDSREYFGEGDECHMAFHFPLMPRLYMALRMEDRFPVVDIMEQTPSIPDNCQWAIFLRNHDELTLEMVSDEERDYMYKTFAKDPRKRINVGIRRRLFPLFGGDTRSIELLNFLLFSMPGTPIVYYGDEIGMGDNYYLGDRDGVRTPMQWSPDKNAGFSRADPQKLFLPVIIDHNYHYTTVNVENMERNPSSFLWWKRRVIAKRKKYKAFGRGSIRFINTSNPHILAFVREFEEESLLVVVNLSRYSQHAELDLRDFAGAIPVEVFSRNEFPMITDTPWSFSMQFKNYFWFELQKQERTRLDLPPHVQNMAVDLQQWNTMDRELQNTLKLHIRQFILGSSWFRGDIKKLRDINLIDVFPVKTGKRNSWVFMVQMDLIDNDKDIFLMPLSVATNNHMEEMRSRHPEAIVCSLEFNGEDAILYDGVYNELMINGLFQLMQKKGRIRGMSGDMEGSSGSRLRRVDPNALPFKPHVVAFRPTNTSLTLGDPFFFRIFRNLQEGENPDAEILKNLSRHTSFSNIPFYAGRIDYIREGSETTTLAVLADLIPNVGSAWDMTQTALDSFFDKVLSEKSDHTASFTNGELEELMDPFFLEMAELLGQRTAQLHQSLASVNQVKGLAPEPFSLLYQKSLYQALRTHVKRTFAGLQKQLEALEPETRQQIQEVIANQDEYLEHIRDILEKAKIDTWKIRIHGNFKLDKLLFTGKDFIFTDFEGESELALSVRKLKHCPLKDVASMLGSLHYAVFKGYQRRKEFIPVNDNYLRPLMDSWYDKVSESFLKGYKNQAFEAGLLPASNMQINELLNIFIFEKAVKELQRFIAIQPEALEVPLKALKKIRAII